MTRVLNAYVIGSAVLNAIVNLNEDEETVIGVGVLDWATSSQTPVALGQIVGFSDLEYADVADTLDEAEISSMSMVSAATIRAMSDADIVIGEGGMSYIIGHLDSSYAEGRSSVEVSLTAYTICDHTAEGEAILLAKEDFISPDNSYVVRGNAEIIDVFTTRRIGGKTLSAFGDLYDSKDSVTVVSNAEAVSTIEYSVMFFSASLRARAVAGSDGSGDFSLDEARLDDDRLTLDSKFVFTTDTPDAGLVIGEAINKATWDESFEITGIAETSAQISETVTSEHTVRAITMLSAVDLYPTKYDMLADPPPPLGLSGDGVVIGRGLVAEKTMPYLINAPSFSPVYSTFQYEITADERYNYSTNLIGTANGTSSVSLSGVTIAIGTSAYPAATSVGYTTMTLDIITVSSRYAGGYSTVTSFPGSPTDGTYVYRSDLGKYYIYMAGIADWVETNKPVGKYDTGQYS